MKEGKISIPSSVQSNEDFDFMMKIILVGESSVGKTNICRRYCFDIFEENSQPTVSFEAIENIFMINEHKIKVCLWDTLGQEKFASVFSQYYRATNGALFIYDLTNQTSFDKIDQWVQTYKDHGERTKIVKFLVGNKSDDLNNRKINKEKALEKVKNLEFDGFYETSALNNININQLIEDCIKSIYFFLYFLVFFSLF
jgi:small GTP-binding protein